MSIPIRRIILLSVFTVCGIVGAAAAGEPSVLPFPDTGLRIIDDDGWASSGRPLGMSGVRADSVYILGGPGRYDGRFEDQFGNPSWQGWTHEDLSAATGGQCMWQVSDFQAINGQYSAWCGTYFDGDPGYGNDWIQQLVFRHQVADPAGFTTVNWTAEVRVDTEPGYDFVRFSANVGGAWQDLLVLDGSWFDPVTLNAFYAPGDYVGSAGDEIQLRIQFTSDQGWSDEDGLWDTDGACQIDDIAVKLNGTLISSEDCEDGDLDDWECNVPFVGDFAALYTHLEDLDPCVGNRSPQVAFVDNGVVVPGTGGSSCTTWCYGPGGYIVNNSGGLMGPGHHLQNLLVSPVMDWPDGMVGLELRASIYVHEEGNGPGDYSTCPGVFVFSFVRSTTDPVAAPIEGQSWHGPWLGLGGSPAYRRIRADKTNDLEAGRVEVQVCFLVWDALEYFGTDGTPAPYIDNVACVAYGWSGPSIGVVDDSYASDAFPAAGDFDLQDPANNAVRFDSIWDLATADDPRIDFGDSLVYDVKVARAGAALVGLPVMQVVMKANPLFDAVRELPPGFVQQGAIITGQVAGDSVYNKVFEPPVLVPDRYAFDLPDSGFFFPGDEIRYCIEARDELAGDVGIALMPADTTGFSDFERNSPFNLYFRARALPTLHSLTPGDQPPVLLWEDVTTSYENWQISFPNLGWELGEEFDWFLTKRFGGGLPNGLGGLATSALLDGYRTLVYTSGDRAAATLMARDVQVLDNWFQRGEKNALMMGDGLVTDLTDGDAQSYAFVNRYLGVDCLGDNVSLFMENRLSPRVRAIPANGFIARVDEWVAWGSCPDVGAMDAVVPVGSTVSIAEFLDANGDGGAYPYAAGTYHFDQASGASVVLLPYDFFRILGVPGWEPPSGYAGIAARTVILEDILAALGEYHPGQPITVPTLQSLAVGVAPNPFNPRSTITLTMPHAGDVSVKIYTVRGEVVRTLLAGRLEVGRHELIWDGATDTGRPAGSGVYFCETRAFGQTEVRKLTLVR